MLLFFCLCFFKFFLLHMQTLPLCNLGLWCLTCDIPCSLSLHLHDLPPSFLLFSANSEILSCLLPPFATQAADFKWNLVGWKYHTASWHGSEKSGRQDSYWISQIGQLCWSLSVSASVNSFIMTAVSAPCLWSCIMCTIRLLTVTESMRFPLISTVLKISIGEKQPSLVWTWELTR